MVSERRFDILVICAVTAVGGVTNVDANWKPPWVGFADLRMATFEENLSSSKMNDSFGQKTLLHDPSSVCEACVKYILRPESLRYQGIVNQTFFNIFEWYNVQGSWSL
jgi:hypothetical protein